jgi:putative peptidoglycan lipid II flippase
MQFPLGIFGVAIASAALPTVSAHAAAGELEGLRKTLTSALRMVFVINIPATFGLIFLSRPIIGLIYEHGRFQQTDTISTSNALIFYAIGLFAYSGIKVLVPAFYALGRSRIPVAISAICVAGNIVMNLWLIGPLGYLGLALGTSLTAIGNFGLLFRQLQSISGHLAMTQIFNLGLKMCVASTAMGAVSMQTHSWLFPLGKPVSVGFEALVMAISIGLGLATLYGACHLLRIEELAIATVALKRKFSGIFPRA